MKNTYKPIEGFENYSVSENGNVLNNRTGRILKPKRSKSGYLRVTLCGEKNNHRTFSIHRLVAIAFIPNPENKPTVNHINEIKTDNRVCNLEWMTSAEQNSHGTRLTRARMHMDYSCRKLDYKTIASRHDYSRPEMCGRKRTYVYRDGKLIGMFNSLREAAESVNANYAKASAVANGKRKTSGGFVFKYHFGERSNNG